MYGAIVSNIGAALVGGPGIVPGCNVGRVSNARCVAVCFMYSPLAPVRIHTGIRALRAWMPPCRQGHHGHQPCKPCRYDPQFHHDAQAPWVSHTSYRARSWLLIRSFLFTVSTTSQTASRAQRSTSSTPARSAPQTWPVSLLSFPLPLARSDSVQLMAVYPSPGSATTSEFTAAVIKNIN